jgi:DNA-binding transcriptional ArsR family regulator
MDDAMTQSLQALADPTRRKILRLLGERDLSAGEIASNFEMSLPSVSHHLSALRNARLVQTERKGQSIVYSLDAVSMLALLNSLGELFDANKLQKQAKQKSAKPSATRTLDFAEKADVWRRKA